MNLLFEFKRLFLEQLLDPKQVLVDRQIHNKVTGFLEINCVSRKGLDSGVRRTTEGVVAPTESGVELILGVPHQQ